MVGRRKESGEEWGGSGRGEGKRRLGMEIEGVWGKNIFSVIIRLKYNVKF